MEEIIRRSRSPSRDRSVPETTYDATGRPYSVTTPHLAGSISSTDGTTYKYYDVLGRPTKVVAPDGSTSISTYSGNTQTITDALSHSKQYTYDAFHQQLNQCS